MTPETEPETVNMKLAQKYPKSRIATRNLYRAMRAYPFGGYVIHTPQDHAHLVPPLRAAVRAMKYGNEIQDALAASVALSYAGKLLRAAVRDAGANRAPESKRKVEHATRITKAAHALLKSLSK